MKKHGIICQSITSFRRKKELSDQQRGLEDQFSKVHDDIIWRRITKHQYHESMIGNYMI